MGKSSKNSKWSKARSSRNNVSGPCKKGSARRNRRISKTVAR